MMMLFIPNPKATALTASLKRIIVGCLLLQLGFLGVEVVQAKRHAKVKPTTVAVEQPASEALSSSDSVAETEVKPAKKSKFKKTKQEAQITAFELEPPANPDYPAQLCGKRRERLVELQTMPWVVKPFFLGNRRVEQWQYRLCLTKTMPEVQRYLESFPVPYTATPAN
jgi:hypothetical protein